MRTIRFLILATLMGSAAGQSQPNYWVYTNGPGVGNDIRSFAVNSRGHVLAGTWSSGGTVWRTTDNGNSWSQLGAIPNSDPVMGISVNAQDHIFISVLTKGCYRSTDDGASWQLKNNGLTNLMIRGNLVDKKGYIWVASEGGLFRSTDNADTWIRVKDVNFAAVCLDSAGAIVTRDTDNIYRSTNSGESWITIPSPGSSLWGIHPDGSYFYWSASSAIYRSTNFGVSWTNLNNPYAYAGTGQALAFNARGDIFYSQSGDAPGVIMSIDMGASWTVVNSGLGTQRVIPLLCHPNGYVFVGTYGFGVYRTRISSLAVPDGMVLVTGGTFQMGSTSGESDEQPVHAVTLSSFYLDAREVTVAQYRAFCTATGRSMPSAPSWGWSEDNPIVNVSWYDATAYCQWAGKRLPTEAEWEYATRGGNKSVGYTYSGSNSLDEVAWYVSNSGGRTHAVATKTPNELELFDMPGNVIEWCSDWHSSWYYSVSPSVNPKGPSTGINRVARGGTWGSVAINCRLAGRDWSTPSWIYPNLGFRCAKDYDVVPVELGSLVITLLNAENWGPTGPTGRVELFNSSGTLIDQASPNVNSVVTFSGIPAGTGYYYKVYSNRATPWGEQFWGEKTGLAVVAGQTMYDTHNRNAPYVPDVRVYLDNTNELLPDSAMRRVQPGTRLRFELQIKNPGSIDAQNVSAYGGLYLDRDKASPYDVNLYTSAQSCAVNSVRTVVTYLEAPAIPGSYYLSVAAFASSSRYPMILTDAGGWQNPAFTVDNSVALPPWGVTNTGISHTIIVPSSVNPNFNGNALAAGDYVGVFYDSSGILACAGYEKWTGTANVAVSAFGDDPTSSPKDGFIAGEVFKWRLYRTSDGKVYDAEATYVPIGGVVTHTNAYATNGISQLASFVEGTIQCQNLRAGWSLISSYVTPQKTSLDSIFKPVLSDVIIVKNGAQKTYIPSVPVNSIGSWVNTEGYQIKLSNARSLCVTGRKIVPETLTIGLPLGWSIMPYVRDNEIPIASALSGVVDDILMVKDQDAKTYIPSVGVNGIGMLKVGQAYQIKMAIAHSMEYPAKSTTPNSLEHENSTTITHTTTVTLPWFYANTGISHTVIVPTSVNPAIAGTPIAVGDFVGVFYDSSGTLACAGFEAWSGTSPLAVSAFGDDPTTTLKDGLAPGETLRWKIWRQSDSHVFVANATYTPPGGLGGIVTDTSKYNTNGISAIATLTGNLTGVSTQDIPTQYALMQNYPNPFNPSTRIGYTLPRNSHVSLTVLNTVGQIVAILVNRVQESGSYELQFDAGQLSSGIYFYRITAEDPSASSGRTFVQTRKLLLLR